MQSSYCPSPYRYTRRVTREVMVGNVGVGGSNPIRIQSMLTSDTRDTDACVKEALELAEAGCEIIRLTAQTKAYAANLENIARELCAAGCHVPLVADIHFKPDAAMEAAKWVEKIRINPGNFVDKKKFEVREYSDAEYREELDRLREEFTPLVLFCREHGRAMRIGSNHGSLSDRILNRFGDTPEGMVESAIEFAQIARDLDYHSLVFSMKASNVKVMVAAYRLLVERMNALGPDWNYPIHLGVTEAGGGEDGRIKSAVGIGSLLTDGIGDTLRVSLTEDAVREVPVAYRLSNPFQPSERSDDPVSFPEPELSYDPLKFSKRQGGLAMCYGVRLGWEQPVRVAVPDAGFYALQTEREAMGDMMPELSLGQLDAIEVDPRCDADLEPLKELAEPSIVTVKNGLAMEPVYAFRLLAARIEDRHLILLKDTLVPGSVSGEDVPLTAARNIGSLLCDGIGPPFGFFPGIQYFAGYGNEADAGGLRFLPVLRAYPVQYPGGDGPHPESHGTSERGEDCRDGMYCEWPRRDGGCGFRLCGRRAEQDQPVCEAHACEVQYSPGGGCGTAGGSDQGVWAVGGPQVRF